MPILDPNTLEFFSRSAEQTRRLGLRLGELLRPGDAIWLTGDLGAGKTTLVQGLAAGWGSPDPATSPTFVLVNVYRRPDGAELYHLDAYRLSGPAEAADLDLEPLLAAGPLVVEWADRIAAALPPDRLTLHLRWVASEHRAITISFTGQRYQEISADLRRLVFAVRT